MNKNSSPLKVISQESKNLMCERLKPWKITISEGKSLKVGNLIAINNSMTPGMFEMHAIALTHKNGLMSTSLLNHNLMLHLSRVLQ